MQATAGVRSVQHLVPAVDWNQHHHLLCAPALPLPGSEHPTLQTAFSLPQLLYMCRLVCNHANLLLECKISFTTRVQGQTLSLQRWWWACATTSAHTRHSFSPITSAGGSSSLRWAAAPLLALCNKIRPCCSNVLVHGLTRDCMVGT